MKKPVLTLILTYAFLALCFFSTMIASAQVDTTFVNNTIDTELPIVGGVLNQVNPIVGQLFALLTPIILFIVRYFERKSMKKKIAFSVKSAMETPSEDQLPSDHEKALNKVVDNLQGNK